MEKSWDRLLRKAQQSDNYRELQNFLEQEYSENKIIYPPKHLIFNAFNHSEMEEIKVVILGQDPYHGPNQAHGLCFSVNDGVRFPPSLRNIFKELESDLGFPIPKSGNLTKWADQGVLLLNTILTVRDGQPGSHQNKGWEQFTDTVIRLLSDEREGLVFLLWGRHAHAKEQLINPTKHFILKAAHPSPLSAYQGFFGCRHFSKTNELLKNSGKQPVNWNLDRTGS